VELAPEPKKDPAAVATPPKTESPLGNKLREILAQNGDGPAAPKPVAPVRPPEKAGPRVVIVPGEQPGERKKPWWKFW
jgi:hypothetical protein